MTRTEGHVNSPCPEGTARRARRATPTLFQRVAEPRCSERRVRHPTCTTDPGRPRRRGAPGTIRELPAALERGDQAPSEPGRQPTLADARRLPTIRPRTIVHIDWLDELSQNSR